MGILWLNQQKLPERKAFDACEWRYNKKYISRYARLPWRQKALKFLRKINWGFLGVLIGTILFWSAVICAIFMIGLKYGERLCG